MRFKMMTPGIPQNGGCRIRAEASLNAEELGVIRWGELPGDEIEVSETVQASGHTWHKLVGQDGWVVNLKGTMMWQRQGSEVAEAAAERVPKAAGNARSARAPSVLRRCQACFRRRARVLPNSSSDGSTPWSALAKQERERAKLVGHSNIHQTDLVGMAFAESSDEEEPVFEVLAPSAADLQRQFFPVRRVGRLRGTTGGTDGAELPWRCAKGHILVAQKDAYGEHASASYASVDTGLQWACNGYRKGKSCVRSSADATMRWRCQQCSLDFCFGCFAAPSPCSKSGSTSFPAVYLERKQREMLHPVLYLHSNSFITAVTSPSQTKPSVGGPEPGKEASATQRAV